MKITVLNGTKTNAAQGIGEYIGTGKPLTIIEHEITDKTILKLSISVLSLIIINQIIKSYVN